jgi:hypothetical protein
VLGIADHAVGAVDFIAGNVGAGQQVSLRDAGAFCPAQGGLAGSDIDEVLIQVRVLLLF